MYIRKVKIENIRCFGADERRVDLDLERPDGKFAGWTVVAGRNGAGKSTFLKALALAVAGPTAARSLEASFAGWIRAGASWGELAIELDVGESDNFVGAGNFSRIPFWAELRLNAELDGPEPELTGMMMNSTHEIAQYPQRGPWAENPKGWFLSGYGPFRRLEGHTVDTVRLMAGPSRLARIVSLFREDASLAECVAWLRSIYLLRLEGKTNAKQLEDNVLALLNDGLLPDGLRVLHVDSEALWTERNGVRLPLRDLSDGYRTVTALVLDLVKQLNACFGDFDLRGDAGSLICPYAGVVLIDEIDIHLHVSWQQRIGFWLKEHFPNIQFIVTTHSPFVCQAADPKGLIRLPAPGTDERAEHVSEELFKLIVNGGSDDAAMTALFGLEHAYSDRSEALRCRVAELEARVIRGSATPEEEVERTRLADQLPTTGSAMVEQALRNLRAAE